MSIKLSAILFQKAFAREKWLDDSIWNSNTLSKLAMRIYDDYSCMKILKNERMTSGIRNAMQCSILTNIYEVLMIYWVDFKKIRNRFKEIYFNTIKNYEENKSKIINLIYTKIELNSNFVHHDEPEPEHEKSIVDSYETYLNLNVPNELLMCHICYNNTINRVLSHEDCRGCCICGECEQKLNSNMCPFCRTLYTSVIKITL